MKKCSMLWKAALLMSAIACLSASAQDKVVNGVAHSELYPGATLDVRVNSCIRDAETGANGAVSHVCDSSGDGGTQTIAGQINVGDAAGDPVTWLLPGAGTWNVTSEVGSSNSAIFQYSFTHIHGTSMPPNRLQITNTASSGGIFAMYTNSANSSTGFYWADGFALRNTTGTTTSGAVMLIPGGFDTSTISYVAVESYVPGTTGIRVGGTNSLCCSAAFDHVTVYDNNTGGIPIDIEGNGAHESFGVWFYASSFGHPAPGLPILKCNDTSSVKQTNIGLFGVYEEGAGADMTVPVNQVTGCASVIAHGDTIAAITSTASAVGWSIDPSFATSLDITGLDMGHGFAHPAKAIVNGASGSTVLTDANGSLTHYASNIDYADNVSAFGTVNAGAGFTIGGNPLSFANLSGSVPTSQLPAASNSAKGIAQCDGTTVTCASGVISAVGGGSIAGMGAVNSISRWTGTSTQGMSSITDNGATVATVEPLSLGAAPALSGQVRLPTGAAISWRNNQNTADVPAVIFGNGNTLFLGTYWFGRGVYRFAS